MTLLTGSNAACFFLRPTLHRRRGLTFIEVMITAIVLAGGLVAIYRAFFIGLDQLDHLSYRLCAINLIEEKIAFVEKDFRSLKDFDIGPLTESAVVNNRPVEFQYVISLQPVGTLLSVFHLDIALSWQEKGREMSISRSAYFSGISSFKEGG
ncbi:MAG: hypothetical protein HQL21_05510 [Candidatus Omnitrophica bacterium]|nr:hypothetical protein [Candidatus Omnitrophota bacterium]